MIKLFVADLKLLVRNRQALFWALMFPLMFTVIFGFFFGKGSFGTGTVGLINNSNSQLAQSIEKAMKETDYFKVQNETDVNASKDLMKQNKLTAVVVIPENFGNPTPGVPTQITIIDDPANAQANVAVMGFIDKFLTQADFQIQNAKPIFSINEEKTNTRELTYFDFIMIGMLGMALMNSSIQGEGVNLANYREEKILKRITTTPLPSWKFIFAEVLSRLILNFVQISLILIVGVYLFKGHIYGSLPLIYLISLVGAVLFQSFGFVIAAFAKTTQAAEGMATAIAIPMMFLAGVFFPIDQLPKWLFSIVQYLPLAPLLRILRGVALEDASPFTNPFNIVLVFGWIVILLAIAIWRFRLTDE